MFSSGGCRFSLNPLFSVAVVFVTILKNGSNSKLEVVMNLPRSSGILLHPTSFPGRYGVGELGASAYAFLDWLFEAGQQWWQVLPLGPTAHHGKAPAQELFIDLRGSDPRDDIRPVARPLQARCRTPGARRHPAVPLRGERAEHRRARDAHHRR